jgi:hypothetical protein
MLWAIELTVGFAQWRAVVGGPDDETERLRWLKMCHRLGSMTALDIVTHQQTRD